jgi:hypothetical protein
MSTWLVVWLLVAIVSTVAVIACLLALARHVVILGRAMRQMREAVMPLADEIAQDGARATGRAASLPTPRSSRRSDRGSARS